MSDHIVHILPEQVASQIAAGEVVERPASAVKELVENSLDAGAHSVSVEILGGGSALIAVADDGSGMTRADAILSLRRHATSKIRSAADLTAIRTLGFRGEALASIASVSHLRMQTRRAADDNGVELAARGRQYRRHAHLRDRGGHANRSPPVVFQHPGAPEIPEDGRDRAGRYRRVVPARRTRQSSYCVSPECRRPCRLRFAARQLGARTIPPGVRSKIATKMLAFDLDRPGIRAQGLAATSQESFATGRMLYTFVNGRAVRDRMLIRAVEQAYQTLIPRGRHPATLLFIDMRPEDVDVNVHPMKTEVRFRNGGAVFDVVYHAIRDRLSDQTESASVSLRRVFNAIRRRYRDGPHHNVVEGHAGSLRRSSFQVCAATRRCGWCPMRRSTKRSSAR